MLCYRLLRECLITVNSEFLHFGQTRVDLNCPWKLSVMKESFLFLCISHASSATAQSSLPSLRTWFVSGLSTTLFRSYTMDIVAVL